MHRAPTLRVGERSSPGAGAGGAAEGGGPHGPRASGVPLLGSPRQPPTAPQAHHAHQEGGQPGAGPARPAAVLLYSSCASLDLGAMGVAAAVLHRCVRARAGARAPRVQEGAYL
jgi:hypothetical protein